MKSLTADDGQVRTIPQIFKKNRPCPRRIGSEMVDDAVLERGDENSTRYEEYEALDTENEAIAIIEDKDVIQSRETNNNIWFEK
jgi:hypothetical protein